MQQHVLTPTQWAASPWFDGREAAAGEAVIACVDDDRLVWAAFGPAATVTDRLNPDVTAVDSAGAPLAATLPAPPGDPVLAAVHAARQNATNAMAEVSGFSEGSGTRQAVQALAASAAALAGAVETLVAAYGSSQ